MNKAIEDEINATEYTCFINEENLDRAYNLLEFFNKNKLILSGFENDDWSLPIKNIFESLLSTAETAVIPVNPSSIIASHILITRSTVFFVTN